MFQLVPCRHRLDEVLHSDPLQAPADGADGADGVVIGLKIDDPYELGYTKPCKANAINLPSFLVSHWVIGFMAGAPH